MPLRRIVSLKVLDWWPREHAAPPPDPVAVDATYACAVERDDAVAPLERWRASGATASSPSTAQA